MKNLVKEPYKIKKNQYLNQIEPFKSQGIPTNCILFKTLPGCGATRSEIEFPRHSIIIEPNVPVIKGKCKEFKTILGVYENVSIDDVFQYLNNAVPHKKLLVTPESFFKIKEAVSKSKFNLYQDFFLLFDECEKLAQDVSFRGDITLPMEISSYLKTKHLCQRLPLNQVIQDSDAIISKSWNYAQHITTPNQ